MDNCSATTLDRRKTFWSTQPCGSNDTCLGECLTFGLVIDGEYGSLDNPNPRSISNANWLAGLAINILMTDGRKPESSCGYKPGRRGGHWSDSFRADGLEAGSLIRNVGKTKTVQESVLLVEAYVLNSMQKLITYGVAQSVKVSAKYAGNNNVDVLVEIINPIGGLERVGLTTRRLQ